MSSTYTKTTPLPSPTRLINEIPSSPRHLEFVKKSRGVIREILSSRDPRLLFIAGPCSIHDVEAAKEYALRLKHLSEEISKSFFTLMRVYVEKPRTTVGWKGLLNDPALDCSHNIEEGLRLTRQLLIDLTEIEIPVAVEFLDPLTPPYFADLVSWGCVGARTTESQPHREMASALPMPIAFKNSTGGNPQIAVNAIIAANSAHTFIGMDTEGCVAKVQSKGNPDAHLVLRGGEEGANYDPESIERALGMLRREQLPENVLIDCSHDNSRRCHNNQPFVFQSVIQQYVEGNKNIRGILLESNIEAGRQEHPQEGEVPSPHLSLTDACLGWDATEYLARWGVEQLNQEKCLSVSACVQ